MGDGIEKEFSDEAVFLGGFLMSVRNPGQAKSKFADFLLDGEFAMAFWEDQPL
jgi:hypothetical protein